MSIDFSSIKRLYIFTFVWVCFEPTQTKETHNIFVLALFHIFFKIGTTEPLQLLITRQALLFDILLCAVCLKYNDTHQHETIGFHTIDRVG